MWLICPISVCIQNHFSGDGRELWCAGIYLNEYRLVATYFPFKRDKSSQSQRDTYLTRNISKSRIIGRFQAYRRTEALRTLPHFLCCHHGTELTIGPSI